MKYIEAIFIKEDSNRFSGLVNLNNELIGCYLPYSCKLGNALNLYGKTVLMLPINGKRFQYKIVAVIDQDTYYYIDLNKINALFEESIAFEYLTNYSRENRITKNYRADFANIDEKKVLELKTVLSVEDSAIYPSVNPVRSIKQMKELLMLKKEGYTVILILILLNRNINQITINDKYVEFSQLFINLLMNQVELHIHEVEYFNNDFSLSVGIKHRIDYDNHRILIIKN